MRLHGKTYVPDGDAYFGNYFTGCDVFELNVLQAGLKHVRAFDVAVDGGAHVGSWTRHLRTLFRSVWAFEPESDNFACLQANTPDSHNFHCGLADEPRLVHLASGSNSGCWHVAGEGEVMLMPLDDFDLPALDYLKLDIEGYEAFALRGAQRTIEKYRPIVQVEEKQLAHQYDGPSARELLKAWGYRQIDRAGRDVIFGP